MIARASHLKEINVNLFLGRHLVEATGQIKLMRESSGVKCQTYKLNSVKIAEKYSLELHKKEVFDGKESY